MLDWRPFFPLERPRPQQEKALDELCGHIVAGKRMLAAELGTGVGKSAVAVCLGRWLHALEPVPPTGFAIGSVVLTAQKILQDQYLRDFPEIKDIRSSSNFKCTGPMGGTCGETWRVRKAVGQQHAQQHLQCPVCPYRQAKDAFAAAEMGTSNYSYFLSEAVYADELPRRHLLVLDEAHNVEDEVRRWSTVEITETEAKKFKEELPWEENEVLALQWLDRKFKLKVEAKLGQLSGKLQKIIGNGKLLDKIVPRLAEENDQLDKRKCQINRLVEFGGRVLVSYQTDRDGERSVKYQPLDVAGLAQELLYARASATLLMSATLLDIKIFGQAVGLTDPAFVQVPTPFKPQAFGVKLRPIGRMSHREIDRTLLDLPRAIQKILDDNPNEKGIIHTISYKVAKAVERVKDPRLLIQRKASDRDEILRLHLSSKEPTVLVSPAMMEGLDLRDDLGRFQIICKVPYPDMSDPVVKQKDWDWYAWRTVRTLTQAAGRCVRSETDWVRTYILDDCFVDVLERNERLVPAHLRASIEFEQPY